MSHECASTLTECANSGQHPRPVVYLFAFDTPRRVKVWVAWGPKSKSPVAVYRPDEKSHADVMTEARAYAPAPEVIAFPSHERLLPRDVAL